MLRGLASPSPSTSPSSAFAVHASRGRSTAVRLHSCSSAGHMAIAASAARCAGCGGAPCVAFLPRSSMPPGIAAAPRRTAQPTSTSASAAMAPLQTTRTSCAPTDG